LTQSEPDASSFPSGGIRSTFEARGYTAWDPTSPAFLLETGRTRTLVIPSVFLSWTGDVLDLKTPLLRSLRALNDAGLKLQRLLGNRLAKRIVVNAGPEQEYFVVSKKLYETRPDLRICGRTLFGAPPAKGQQMEDHYFGAIHPKMIRFMEDLDHELYRRGIPAKTRHNEVSPNQFEIAPLYEEANLATDHNLQTMDIMKKVALTHDLVVLLHEKPFAGLNGSGKHANWSIGDNTGANFLEPSASPLKNVNFLLTLGALMQVLGPDFFPENHVRQNSTYPPPRSDSRAPRRFQGSTENPVSRQNPHQFQHRRVNRTHGAPAVPFGPHTFRKPFPGGHFRQSDLRLSFPTFPALFGR